MILFVPVVGPSGRAVQGVGLRPFACCDRDFEFHLGMNVFSVVCCKVEVFATICSLVQRSPTYCGASLCVIKKLLGRGHSPRWAVEPEKIIINNNHPKCKIVQILFPPVHKFNIINLLNPTGYVTQ
jgi:hypothetical protein